MLIKKRKIRSIKLSCIIMIVVSLGCGNQTDDSRSHSTITTRKSLSKEALIDLVTLKWSDFSNDEYALNNSLGVEWSLFSSPDSALKIVCVSNEMENSDALLVCLLNDKIVDHKWIRKGNEFGIDFNKSDITDSDIFYYTVNDVKGSGIYFERIIFECIKDDSIMYLGNFPKLSYVSGWDDLEFEYSSEPYKFANQDDSLRMILSYKIENNEKTLFSRGIDTVALGFSNEAIYLRFYQNNLSEAKVNCFLYNSDRICFNLFKSNRL